MSKDWSRDWGSASTPAKQRKYRRNAPYHQRQQFLNARLAEKLRDKVGTKTLPVVTGDKVEVMRGDHSGERGEIREIDRDEQKVFVEGVDRETVSGSDTRVAIDPSNLKVTKLNLDDDARVEKYEVTEAEKEAIAVEEDDEADEDTDTEEEEAEAADEEETEEGAAEETDTDTASDEVAYEDIVSGTVAEVKDRVEEDDLDVEAVLEAEQANKDRVTLVEWLETRVNDDE